MKKIICAAMFLVVIFSFVGCKPSDGGSGEQSTASTKEEVVIERYEECYGINDGRNIYCSFDLPSTVKRLKMPDVFGDYMMFQRNKPIRIWGLAPAGENIGIRLFDKNGECVSAKGVVSYEDNSFIAELPAKEASTDEYTLKINCGATERKYEHILIGEVFLASGQSNMQVTLADTYEGEELLKKADNKNIRIYNPPIMPKVSDDAYSYSLCFETECGVQNWTRGDDKTVSGLGSVSAIGYSCAIELFARIRENEGKNVPVGFLNLPVGGTSILSWLPRYAAENSDLKREIGSDYSEYSEEKTMNYSRFTALFNSKIAPVINMNISSLIWYQGETDAGRRDMYALALEELVKDYGTEFRFEKMPAVVCHIAPFNTGAYTTDVLGTTYFNTVFDDFVLSSEDTRALVALYDCDLRYEKGDFATIHPRVKQEIGVRCGKALFGLLNGGDNTNGFTSPIFKSSEKDGDSLVVTFSHVGDGLISEGRINGFSVAGKDKAFFAAEAEIIAKDKIRLSSRYVSEPEYCSYAYSSLNMKANLKNKDGFAVSPFVSAENVSGDKCFCQHDWLSCDDLTCWRYLPPVKNADGTYKYTADYVQMYSGDGMSFSLDKENAAVGNCLKMTSSGASSLTVKLNYPYDVHQFNRFNLFSFMLKGELELIKTEIIVGKTTLELTLTDSKKLDNGYTEYVYSLRTVKIGGSTVEKYKYPDFLDGLKISFGGSGVAYLDEMSLGK